MSEDKTIFDELRAYSVAKLPTIKDLELEEKERRKRDIIEAMAKAMIYDTHLVLDNAHLTHKYCNHYPNRNQLINLGGVQKAEELLYNGDVQLESPLNGSFVLGLKLGGAISYAGAMNRYYIPVHIRELLIEDISAHGYAYDVEAREVGWYLRRALFLNCVDKVTDDRCLLAGIFASMKYVSDRDGTYGRLRYSKFLEDILKSKFIPYDVFSDHIRVSPFFYLLFSPLMPDALGSRYLDEFYPYQCPLVSALYWDLLLKNEGYIMPERLSLPYGCARSTFYSLGLHLSDIEKFKKRYHIFSVDKAIRTMIMYWHNNREGICEEEVLLCLRTKWRLEEENGRKNI